MNQEEFTGIRTGDTVLFSTTATGFRAGVVLGRAGRSRDSPLKVAINGPGKRHKHVTLVASQVREVRKRKAAAEADDGTKEGKLTTQPPPLAGGKDNEMNDTQRNLRKHFRELLSKIKDAFTEAGKVATECDDGIVGFWIERDLPEIERRIAKLDAKLTHTPKQADPPVKPTPKLTIAAPAVSGNVAPMPKAQAQVALTVPQPPDVSHLPAKAAARILENWKKAQPAPLVSTDLEID